MAGIEPHRRWQGVLRADVMASLSVIHSSHMKVMLSQLEKAQASLRRSIAVFDRVSGGQDIDLIETTRSGVVQNFKVAYEQSWKVLRRWMMQYLGISDSEIAQRRQLYRLAAKNSLINDVEAWWDFHVARNLTSHTYNEAMALEVVEVAHKFDVACVRLIENLAASSQDG